MNFSQFTFLISTYHRSKFQGNLRHKGDMTWMTCHGITLGSEVTGMKIVFFVIFDPTWTHILAPERLKYGIP